jgi:LacI family transcriptional regulator
MFSVDKLLIFYFHMRSQTTLKQISEMLQISISTVSRALKDHPDIAVQTKNKVKELAELMEYEPNSFAVQLRTNASKLIGVIVPEISGHFYHSYIAGLEEEARSWGYSLMILQSNNQPESELENLRLCRFNRAAGVLIALSPQTADLTAFHRTMDSGTPIVFFDKVPDVRGVPKVCIADAEAAYLAADLIIKKKKKNVLAIFGEVSLSITRKRLKAFLGTFQRSGPDIKLQVIHAVNSDEAGKSALTALMGPDKPDTIFCMSDEILVGVIKAANKLKLSIPTDISMISISNGMIPSLFEPEITYIETSGNLLGKKSFDVLHRCLLGKPPQGEVMVGARIIEGGSM